MQSAPLNKPISRCRTAACTRFTQPSSICAQRNTSLCHPCPIQSAQIQVHVRIQLRNNYHANFECQFPSVTIRNDSETCFSNFNGLIP
ncbi:hypothetical protein EMGBS3_03190 [Anaerolineaceae bacterium]|nr:hypothetical protein EMGBS3_03190 [Anaerolineaceae bacterium]